MHIWIIQHITCFVLFIIYQQKSLSYSSVWGWKAEHIDVKCEIVYYCPQVMHDEGFLPRAEWLVWLAAFTLHLIFSNLAYQSNHPFSTICIGNAAWTTAPYFWPHCYNNRLPCISVALLIQTLCSSLAYRSPFHKITHCHSDIKLMWDGCEVEVGLVDGTGSRIPSFSCELLNVPGSNS